MSARRRAPRSNENDNNNQSTEHESSTTIPSNENERKAQIEKEIRKIENTSIGKADHIDFSQLLRGPIKRFNPSDYSNKPNELFDTGTIIETANNKLLARKFRAFTVLIIPLILLILLSIFRDTLNVNFMYGISLQLLFTIYFIHLFYIFTTIYNSNICNCLIKFLNCNNYYYNTDIHSNDEHNKNRSLFRVYSLNSIIPDNTDMCICYRALMFKYQSINSISEFSAIQGGYAFVMLLVISSYSWVIILCSLTPLIHKYGIINYLSLCDIFELIGCFGLVIIGTFELDPFNKKMQNFHNTGALMGSFTLIGYLLQQYIMYNNYYDENINNINNILYRFSLPILLILIAIIAYYNWDKYTKIGNKYNPLKEYNDKNIKITNKIEQEIRKQVTNVSFGNVISEAFVLYSGSTAMCLWLMNFDYCHEKIFAKSKTNQFNLINHNGYLHL